MKRFLSVLTLLFLLLEMLTGCGLRVPRPEIKKGEFAFSVTYELHGEVNTVSGIFVCEFAGLYWTLEGGYGRDWSGYIKDGKMEEIIVLETAEDGGQVELNLHFDPGHFMGDNGRGNDEPFSPWIDVRLYDEGLYFENDTKIVEEVYGARIISYEYDAPIENTFTRFDFN